MMNRQKTILAALAVVIFPFVPSFASGTASSWTALGVSRTWEYSDYRVDQVKTSSNTIMKFGDTVVRVDRAASCIDSCDMRDLYILSNGGAIKVSDVPTRAVDEQQVAKNDGRLVYAEFSNDAHTRVNVIEIDLSTGMKSTLLSDKFVTDADTVDVTVDGTMIYAQVSYSHSLANDMYPQQSIYVYNPRYEEFQQLYHQWELRYEELMDVKDGHAIVKMTFPAGEEQLWVYDYVEFGEQSATAVPNTWTAATEDLVAVHYTDNGSIEFFRQYARNLTDATLTTTTVNTQYLNWYRAYDTADLRDIVQVSGNTMVWLDPTSELYTSDGAIVKDIGNLTAAGSFAIVEDRILWNNGTTGGVSTLAGESVATVDFLPSDVLKDVVVGQDVTGNVIYKNLTTDKEMTIGFGGSPRISDDRHVYWKGEDAHIYQATVFLTTAMDTTEGTPIKTASSPRVYILSGNNIAYIPNEIIYGTWFDSFGSVVTVSDDQLASYSNAASVTFKPGTKLRVDNGSKIYVVGSDGAMHWLVTEAVAKSLYGSTWSQEILAVTSAQVMDVAYGASISSANDMSKNVMIATIK